MKPTYSIINLQHNMANIPADRQVIIATTLTKDVARYVAAAVDLPSWPKTMALVGSQISLEGLQDLAKKIKYPEHIQTNGI